MSEVDEVVLEGRGEESVGVAGGSEVAREVKEKKDGDVGMGFDELPPLRRKTLELMLGSEGMDGAEAERVARRELGLDEKSVVGGVKGVEAEEGRKLREGFRKDASVKNIRTTFVPALGNLGTTKGLLDLNSARERLRDLPRVELKDVLLQVLSASSRQGSK